MPSERDRERQRERGERERERDRAATLENVLHAWAASSTDLQQQTAGVLQRLSDTVLARNRGERIHLPKYDGSRSFAVFDAQFVSAAAAANWSEEEKGRRLLNSLDGAAADLVQTLPQHEFLNYASPALACPSTLTLPDEALWPRLSWTVACSEPTRVSATSGRTSCG